MNCRAFGFDKRVLQLNYDIDWNIDFPAPQMVSKLIRFVVDGLKRAAKTTMKSMKAIIHRFKRSRAVDEEANAENEERSPAEIILAEYQATISR